LLTLAERVTELGDKIRANEQRYVAEKRRYDRLKAELEAVQSEAATVNEALELCKVSLKERVKTKEDFEDLLTIMARALFEDENYTFKFELIEKDGIVVGADPTIYYMDVPQDPADEGDGMMNILSNAARMLFVLLHTELSPVMIWDEPNTGIDAKKWPLLVTLLSDIFKDIPGQIIAITHSGAMFPQTFEVTKPALRSIVKEL
jgi:DNA repair exonuclease SbcCD ATPase subunit